MPSTNPGTDPDKLIRQQAGSYRSADERFEVRQTDQGWYLVDSQQTDDLGQELVRGPYPTLMAVRTAIPPARSDKVVPLPRRAPTRSAGPRAANRSAKPSPPPSWIDRLPQGEARRIRRVVAALEAEGIPKAEQLVRRDREGLLPAVATTLLRARIEAILEDASPAERRRAMGIVALLTGEGTLPDELPRWMLVEIGPEPPPRNRRISL